MNDKQNAKVSMAQYVLDTSKSYAAVYSDMPPMVAAVKELETNIADILETNKSLATVSVPISSLEKREAESQMIDLCVKVAKALYVIGFSTGDKVLMSLLGMSPSRFYHKDNTTAMTLALQISDLAQAHASELTDYGYTPEKLTAIATAIETFRSLILKPRETIGVRKQKITNLKQLFASLNSTLYDKLDNLIVLFKDSHPDFYGEYRTARNLIQTSARHKKSVAEESKA
jgi:hypothetical protein